MKRLTLVALLAAACDPEQGTIDFPAPEPPPRAGPSGCVGLPDLEVAVAGKLELMALPFDERVKGHVPFEITNAGVCPASDTILIKPFMLARGDAEAGGHHAAAAVSSVLPTQELLVELEPGESRVYDWSGEMPRIDRHDWKLSVLIDARNELREEDERNNVARLTPVGWLEVTRSHIVDEVGLDFYTDISGQLSRQNGGVAHSLELISRPYPSAGAVPSPNVWARFMLADLDGGEIYSLVYTSGFVCMADSWCPAPLLCNEDAQVCTPDGTGTGEIVEKQWYALVWGMYMDELGRAIGIDYYWQAPKFINADGTPFVPPGEYQFLTFIDTHDLVDEFDEANNIDAVPFDLSILEVVGTPNTWFVKTATNPAPTRYVEVRNVSGAAITYNVSVPADAPWLSISPSSGTLANDASVALPFQVDATGLAVGEYQTEVTISAAGFEAHALHVPVRFFVYDAASGTPLITVTPTSLETSAPVGFHPAPLSFTISDPGVLGLEWEAWTTVEWISIAPPSGAGPPGYSETVNLFIHPEGMAPGTYTGLVHIFHNAPGPTRTVLVEYTVM